MNGPLIILAPGRCFSSLICAMLGQHPRLYGILETQLLVRESMDEWLEDFGGGIHAHGLLRSVAQIVYGDQTAATIDKAQAWLWRRRRDATSEILAELAAEVAPLLLVEKTPMLTYRPEHMRRAERVLPSARFLHIARHPAGYGRSLLEFFRHRAPLHDVHRVAGLLRNRESIFFGLFDDSADPPGFDPQHTWFLRHSEVREFTASLVPARTLLIRPEGLFANPEPELRSICEWLGLTTDAGAIDEMKHPERSPFARLGPRTARFGGDPKFLSKPALRVIHSKLPDLDAPMPWSAAGTSFSSQVRCLASSLGYA